MKVKFISIIKNKYIGIIGALLCTMLWGTAFPLIKYDYKLLNINASNISSMILFAGIRFTLAGLMVFLIGFICTPKAMKLHKQSILNVVSLGLVQTFLQYLFSTVGVGLTTATNTSIITGITSLVTVIMAGIFVKGDRLNIFKISGCLIGFAGILIINIAGIINGQSFTSVSFIGDIIVLVSTFCGAGGNIITKNISNTSPFALTAWQLSLGGVLLLVTGFVFGGRIDISNIIGMLIILWLSFVSAISFALWTILLRYHKVSKIAVFNMLVPIFGTIISGIVLGENIVNVQNIIALILVSAGIVIVNTAKSSSP